MVLGEDGCASSTLLLRAVPSLKRKLSQSDAQTFLRALVRDKWFEEPVRAVLLTENCVEEETHTHTHKTSTVTVAAHGWQGLIIHFTVPIV